jgi:Flp pilus assembly protein TadG
MRRFWADTKGNIAVLFALAIVPVIGGIGAAVDYSMASAYRTDMQQALDSTALALTKILPADQETIDKAGMEYFAASMGNHNLTNLTLTITPENGKVKLAASGDYTPKIASILGVDTFEVGTKAEARWSLGKLEIALVLDNSGSMSSLGRMTALKAATHDLLNVLEDAAKEPGDAKVAIVPFDSGVRIDHTYNNAPPWVRFDWWDENYGQNTEVCTNLPGKGKGKGKGKGGGNNQVCETVWQPETRQNWVGCINDRDRFPNLDYDVLDTEPNMDLNGPVPTKFPARKCDDNSMPSVLALTEDWDGLRSKTDSMTPSGWTNITIGLVWGWHLLSPTPIFSEGAAYGTEDLTKYVILMTDGDNTRSRHSNNTAVIDSRTEAVCSNIKDAGIKIYSIRLIQGNANLIRNCASDPSMYYDVQNAGQLSAVFTSIGSEIASLHLSK